MNNEDVRYLKIEAGQAGLLNSVLNKARRDHSTSGCTETRTLEKIKMIDGLIQDLWDLDKTEPPGINQPITSVRVNDLEDRIGTLRTVLHAQSVDVTKRLTDLEWELDVLKDHHAHHDPDTDSRLEVLETVVAAITTNARNPNYEMEVRVKQLEKLVDGHHVYNIIKRLERLEDLPRNVAEVLVSPIGGYPDHED